jgi:uncharacterized membrane protein YccC
MNRAMRLLAPDDPLADEPARSFAALVEALEAALARNDRDALGEFLAPRKGESLDAIGQDLRTFHQQIIALPTDDPRAGPWSALYERGRAALHASVSDGLMAAS